VAGVLGFQGVQFGGRLVQHRHGFFNFAGKKEIFRLPDQVVGFFGQIIALARKSQTGQTHQRDHNPQRSSHWRFSLCDLFSPTP